MEALQGQGEDGLEACTECGYLIAYALGVRCSECGHLYGTVELEMAHRRGGLLEDSRRFVKKAMGLWIGALALYVIGGLLALFVVDPQMPWDVVFGMVVGLVGLVVGSIFAGWIAARFGPVHHRRVIWLLWLRVLPTIHLSWLSIGGFTVIGGVLALLGRLILGSAESVGNGGFFEIVLATYVLFSFLMWAIGSLAVFPIWATRLVVQNGEYGVQGVQPAVGLVGLAATLTWLVGCLFGFAGGVMGTGLIYTIGSI